MGSWFGGVIDKLVDLRNSILGKLGDLLSGLKEKIDTILAPVIEIREKIISGFRDIAKEIISLPEKIREKVFEIFEYFFIPDKEKMDARFAAVQEKFYFVRQLSDAADTIKTFFNNAGGSSAPVLTIDLSKYKGRFNWGSGVIRMDFSWYAPYKPFVDNVVAGIIWLCFLWNTYRRLPELIRGQGMITNQVLDAAERSRKS